MENFDQGVSLTVTTVRAALQQREADVARGMGISQSALNRKVLGKSNWTVKDLSALGASWGCHPSDLLQGPTHALQAIIGKAPRQLERSSAA
jgi:hypothetical protein